LLVILIVQKRPATEAPISQVESAKKATGAGTNWEIFRFDWGALAECTGIFDGTAQHQEPWRGQSIQFEEILRRLIHMRII
jgi:hypothetical protein